MSAKQPTSVDQSKAMSIALGGIAQDVELGEIALRLDLLLPKVTLLLGQVLLDLAADAIEESGATRALPLQSEGIRDRYLPEDRAHTKAQHLKIEYAIRAAAMIRGGVDPALAEVTSWWRTDDLDFWALEALVIFVRAASDRTGQSVAQLCERIAQRHDLDLSESE